jgi:hypothetical protein
MLWQTVSRPVYLGVKPSSWAQDQIFVTDRQLRVCSYGEPSLTRGRVCRLQLLLVLASAVNLWYKFRGTHDHILLSHIRDSPNLEGQVPVFISPSDSVAQLYPQALGSLFIASYDSQGYGGGIRTRLHADIMHCSNCPLYNISVRTAQKPPLPCCCVQFLPWLATGLHATKFFKYYEIVTKRFWVYVPCTLYRRQITSIFIQEIFTDVKITV